MPWQGVSIVDSRMAFLTEHLTGQASMTELAAAYGVSRPTAYYWVQRVSTGRSGAARRGLAPSAPDAAGDGPCGGRGGAAGPRSPSPLGRGQIAGVVTAAGPGAGVAVSRHDPSAARTGRKSAPAAAAPGRVAPPPHLRVPTAPNVVWTVDFKGEFRTGDGRLCYPFTCATGTVGMCCGAPRCRRCGGAHHAGAGARVCGYGLPERIRSDNGPPFGSPTSLARCRG